MWMIEGGQSYRMWAGGSLWPLKPALNVECSNSRSEPGLVTHVQGEGSRESSECVVCRRRSVVRGLGRIHGFDAQRTNSAFDFIAGNRPVTEDQVRQKLVSDGWMDVRIVLRGRYFVGTASKDGESSKFSVDALTGRLRGEDDDCDDPLYDYDDIVTATKRPQ